MSVPSPLPSTSPSLLLRIRDSSDTQSWLIFEEVYGPIILAWCLKKGVPWPDVEDVVQEVLIAVATSIKTFDYDPIRGRFRSWLGTIASNKVNSYFARIKSYAKSSLEELLVSSAISDPDSDWVAIYAAKIFEAATERIRQLVEPTTWQCFESTWIARQPAAEVADRLGVPIHTVYVNKSRVLKRLETEVAMLADDIPQFSAEDMNE